MATSTRIDSTPFGMGKASTGWFIILVALLAVVGAGAYAYSRQIVEGEIVTGLRDVGPAGGAPWGLYIAFELWAVGIGFGAMMLIAASRLFGWSHLVPLNRILAVMALATLFIGGWSVIADVGHPFRAVINIIRYARPMSPFFGTFTVGLVAAFASMLVYLYLDGRREASIMATRPGRLRGWFLLASAGYKDSVAERIRRQRTNTVMAVVLGIIGVFAASTSAFVFGVQQGRPGWFGALQAPGFVILAGATGVAATILVAALLRAELGDRESFGPKMFKWLNNILLGLTLMYIYILLVELVTSSYSSSAHAERVTDAIIRGEYAWMFWLSSGLFLLTAALTAVQAIAGRYNLRYIVLAAVILNVAAILKRYLIVVPGLTVGRLLPYPEGSYNPTWVEYLVVIGLAALAIVFFMVFMKVFPIVSSQNGQESEGE
ncbi:MAG: polysulfide reductase NrfD [Chloroflexi bacterium]|nr:polysulfide reductase NrfD [Chloroflexota bacterium]